LHEEICFFGLQYLIKKHLVGQVVTEAKIQEAKELFGNHLGPTIFNEGGWRYILEAHNGKLPIRIKALPEGTVIGVKNCCITVENTDPKCYWLVNYLETLLVEVWYPMTVASNSREMKKILMHYLNKTGDVGGLGFKLHDFGFRGVSSVETAGIGGAAHLTQFLGTDTMAALVVAKQYYNCPCAGFSIPASEHSTMTTWGATKDSPNSQGGEVAAMENMLDQYPSGLVACVSDSYDLWDACSNKWGGVLKEKVLAREGTLVVRPDSGPPQLIPLGVLEKLGAALGSSTNSKGFKVLPDQVRVIQGDGIDFNSLMCIVGILAEKGWSIDNIAFGSGGGLLQKLNRDTQKCAFKCSLCIVNGKDIDVFKSPAHDLGKQSKRGRMTVNQRGGKLVTLCGTQRDEATDVLATVFENGVLVKEYSFDDVRKNAEMTVESLDGAKIEATAKARIEEYKAKQYAADLKVMRAVEPSYTGPYAEAPSPADLPAAGMRYK
jgi:nicotinamide phosphoribosyltransferase